MSLARALVRNIRAGRYMEGGSTITQQLVKNFFLSQKKTIWRKLTEIAMSMLIELHSNKDNILETYLNIIYLGQSGPYQVRGYGAASQYYFGKELEDLSLDQCAMLAAVINSPGTYNPFTAPDKTKERRNLVLRKMTELQLVSEEMAIAAEQMPLPEKPHKKVEETAPYFVEAIQKQLEELKINQLAGLRVVTTMNIQSQKSAQLAVSKVLPGLEKRQKHKDKNLEGVLLAADLKTGFVTAVVGGANFRKSQFNRAISSKRQVGSLMKPFVYLAALENLDTEGKAYTPLTMLDDEPFTHRYEGQVWSPENYNQEYFGRVPLYFALKHSLNAATAHLAIQVGVPALIDVAKRFGIQSYMAPVPSLSLGAFELYPWEMLQAYLTIGRFGSFAPLTYISRVYDLDNHIVYQHKLEEHSAAEAAHVAVLVGMMNEATRSGTARILPTLGFTQTAAGKTGTTSNYHDAWFAGFTPTHVAVSWVGYDDNTPHDMTGAAAALPIWAEYMKAAFEPEDIDFKWPDDVVQITLPQEKLRALGIDEKVPAVKLIFRRGEEPQDETESFF